MNPGTILAERVEIPPRACAGAAEATKLLQGSPPGPLLPEFLPPQIVFAVHTPILWILVLLPGSGS